MRQALPAHCAVIAGWCWLGLGPFSSFHHGASNEAWADSLSSGAPDTPRIEGTAGLQPPPAATGPWLSEGARVGEGGVLLQGEFGDPLCPQAVRKGHCP